MMLLLANLAFASAPGGGCVLPPSFGAKVLESVRELSLDPVVHRQVVNLSIDACADLRADSDAVGAAWDLVDDELAVPVPVMADVLRATDDAGRLENVRQAREMTFVVQVAATVGPENWAKVEELLAEP